MVKKVIAVFLSAVLFCLASGTAFADHSHDLGVYVPLSSSLLNDELGTFGPLLISDAPDNVKTFFEDYRNKDGEGFIVLGRANHFVVFREARYSILGNFNWELDRGRLGITENKRLEGDYVLFNAQEGSFVSFSERNFWNGSRICADTIFSYNANWQGDLSLEGIENVWEPARTNPKALKIVLDTDPPSIQSHNLTINYIHTNGQEAAPAYSVDLQEGESYSIPSPAVEGYAPDRLTVAGTMGAADVLETVIYNPDAKPPEEIDPPDPGTAGTVTVHYHYEDGSTAAPTKTQTLGPGQMFQILSPEVPGYTPSRKIIFGYTGSKELVYDVTYTQQVKASAGGILFAPPDKQDGITWSPGGNGGITWQPNNGGGITFQPKQSGGIAFVPPKSIGAYPFDIPRRWSLWN